MRLQSASRLCPNCAPIVSYVYSNTDRTPMGHSSDKVGAQLGHRLNRIVTEWQERRHSWHAVQKQLCHNSGRVETHPEHNLDTAVTPLRRNWGAVATQLKYMSGWVPQEQTAEGLRASAVRSSSDFSSLASKLSCSTQEQPKLQQPRALL